MNPVSLKEIYKQMRAYFDRDGAVLARLNTEEEPDGTSGTCMYRTWDGKKCAVGALIPDANYRPYFESTTAETLTLLLGRLAGGVSMPSDWQENGVDFEALADYASVDAEGMLGNWLRPAEEQENARVLHRILDDDKDKRHFLSAAQVIHDQEAYNAEDLVARLDELARAKGVIA